MTLTSPPPGARVASRDIRARRFAAVSAGLASLLMVLGLCVIGGAAPATAAATERATAAEDATPSPSPTEPAVLSGETTFTLSPVARGTVRPGESLAVSVTLQNGTDAATPPIPVTLSLGATALTDRTALSTWLAGDGTGVDVAAIGAVTLESVPSGGDRTQGIVVAPGDPALAGRAPGIYPLVADYNGPEGAVHSTSVMIVPDDAATPIGIGLLVPITAPPLTTALLSATELIALTSPQGSLTQQLEAVEGTEAILAVDPAIVAAIRVLGAGAPPTATEWLTRLDALPNSRFALQYGDADVATQLAAGAPAPLTLASLQFAMAPNDFLPTQNAPTSTPTGPSTGVDAPAAGAGGSTPTPTATDAPLDPTTPVYPTTTELLRVDGARDATYWPAGGTASPDIVAALGAIAVDDRASVTVLPSTSTTAGAAGGAVAAHARAGSADALVYDADVSRELRDASLTDDSSLRGAPLTAAAAYLAFAVKQTGSAPLLVTVDRAAARSTLALRTAITSALQTPGVVPSALGGLLAAAPVEVAVTNVEPDPARVAQASALFDDEAAIGRFATILDDVTLLTGPERAQVLQLLGVGWLPDAVAWNTAVAEHRAATAVTLDSVGILPPSSVNLYSADAPLPVWVRNDLPYPVTVVLSAIPDDLRLTVQEQTIVPAGAQSNTRQQVPVQARVGSGDVDIALQLQSMTAEQIGAPQVVEVSVRAEWEGIGITVLAILVGAFVVLGVIRTVLRLRARRRAGDGSSRKAGA